jgi:hypothetical protein
MNFDLKDFDSKNKECLVIVKTFMFDGEATAL